MSETQWPWVPILWTKGEVSLAWWTNGIVLSEQVTAGSGFLSESQFAGRDMGNFVLSRECDSAKPVGQTM